MSQFKPNTTAFNSLRGKVVVLTGGATGIGAATTTLLTHHGAHVIFGDINTTTGNDLANSLNSSSSSSSGTAKFIPCDVRNYTQLHDLFHTALSTYGHVDHAVSCAGIFEQSQKKFFDPDLTVDSVGDAGPGDSVVIDVNVLGTANFSRIALVYLRHENGDGGADDGGAVMVQERSLTLLSSVNAFRESPGLYMYQTSKHAIQGLMRSMRQPASTQFSVRVNCVCPGMTESEMTRGGIIEAFKEQNLFWQSAEVVAEMILGIMVDRDMKGKAIYVEGGDGWEFEDGFYKELPRWLGEEPTRRMKVNAEAVSKGALLKKG